MAVVMLCIYMVTAATCFVVYQYWFHPLSHIPGPFISRFIPLVKVRYILNGKTNSTRKMLHDIYGPVVRVSPGEVSFATTTSFDTIYGLAGERVFDMAGTVKGILGTRGDLKQGISNTLRKEDRIELRSLVKSTLSDIRGGLGQELFDITFQEIIDKHNISKNPHLSISLDAILTEILWVYGSRLSLGITAKVADLHLDDQLRWLDEFWCFLECIFCIFSRFTVQAYIKWFFKAWQAICFVMGKPTDMPPAMDGSIFLKPIIAEFPENHFSRLKAAVQKSKSKLSVTDSTLTQNAVLTWLSIYGVSHHPLHGTFYYLLQNTRCLQKLEQEILAACNSVANVNDKNIGALPYLNACINESLRLVAPFNAGILHRVSRGATVDGVYLPPGVSVATDVYTIAHSSIYWDAPEEFIPERWLAQGPNDDWKASRPFGIGNRSCLGRELALQMFRLIVAKTLYSYKLDLVNKDFNIHRDCHESFQWNGIKLNVRIESRF